MKIISALLCGFVPCFAVPPSAPTDPWTARDYALESVVVAEFAVDWKQSSDIHERYWNYECNPIMGRHPRQSTINQYFATTTLLHIFFADQLSGKWRTAWQATWIGVEAGVIGNNYKIGIHLTF